MSKLTVTAGEPISMEDSFCDWLRLHDIVPEHTWRVKIDGDTMTVYQYATDGGEVIIGEAGVVQKDPFKVEIKEELPDDIWLGKVV